MMIVIGFASKLSRRILFNQSVLSSSFGQLQMSNSKLTILMLGTVIKFGDGGWCLVCYRLRGERCKDELAGI